MRCNQPLFVLEGGPATSGSALTRTYREILDVAIDEREAVGMICAIPAQEDSACVHAAREENGCARETLPAGRTDDAPGLSGGHSRCLAGVVERLLALVGPGHFLLAGA